MDIQKVVERVQQGHKEEFNLIMDNYFNEIFKFVYNTLGDYESSEDVVQEIFYRIYKNIKQYNPSLSSFRTWMYRVANNYTLNYLKSRQYKYSSNKVNVDIEVFETDEDIEGTLITDEQLSEIVNLMSQSLSKKHMKIMQLRYFSGLEVSEISEVMQIPQKTIYKAIKSSIEKIKKEVL